MSTASTKVQKAMVALIAKYPFEASILARLRIREHETGYGSGTMATDGRTLWYCPAFVEAISLNEVVAVLAHEADHCAKMHPLRMLWREPVRWNIACDQEVNALMADAGLTLPKGSVPGVPDATAELLYSKVTDQQMKVYGGAPGTVCAPKGPGGRDLTRAERWEAEQKARQMVASAAQTAKACGKLSAGWQEALADVLEPRIPWQDVLARWVGDRNRENYSYRRPNRRHLGRGFVLPSMDGEDPPQVVQALDTSGSISREELQMITSEVCHLLNQFHGCEYEHTLLWFDHDVYPQQVTDPSELQPVGRGGTAFSPIFDWCATNIEREQGIIVVTDGYCDDYGEAPEQDVLWILVGEQHRKDFSPPFGEVAYVID